MMLTKEECEEALSSIEFTLHLRVKPKKLGHSEDNNLNVLWGLIIEHFSNPPLKFEELKEGMWIWDKEEEEWLWLCAKRKENDKEYLRVHSIYECDSVCKFEPNRFYRKEVQE